MTSPHGREPRPELPEVPELELAPAATRSAAPRVAPVSRPPTPAASSAPPDAFGGGALDLEEGPALALELGESPAASGGVGAPPLLGALPGATFDSDLDEGFVSTRELAAEPRTSAPAAAASTRPWPTGAAPDRAALALDPVEIAIAARFGAAPGPAGAPRYALATWRRLRELRPIVVEQARALAVAELARDEALAALLGSVRSALSRDQRLARLLEPVIEQERLAAERDAGLGRLDADHQARLAELDAGREALRTERAAAAERLAAHEAELDAKEQVYRRVEARWKRFGIEARAPRERVEQARAAGAPPPADALAQLAALEGQAAAMEPEVAAARGARDGARALRDATRRELDAVDVRGREVDARERGAAQAYAAERGVRSQATDAARAAALEASATAAREVLRLRGGVPVADSELDDIRDHDARVLALTRAHEHALRMLDAYDAPAYALGWRLLAGAAAVVALALLWLIAR
ncbi:MAG: hypothetical protein IT376_02595 [Polyangiaceae bacterium]|nr:hypothetical protein [Polyangiaceae bacterium]